MVETPFVGSKERETHNPFLSSGNPTGPVGTTPSNILQAAEYTSQALNLETVDTYQRIAQGYGSLFELDMTRELQGLRRGQTERAFESMDFGSEAEQGQLARLQLLAQRENTNVVSPSISLMIERENPEVAQVASNFYAKQNAFLNIVNQRMESAGQGVLPSIGYFLDSAITSTVSSLAGPVAAAFGNEDIFTGEFKFAELAEELNSLMLMDIGEEEFTSRVNQIIDRGYDAGFFSDTNPFYLGQLTQLTLEGGIGGSSQAGKLMQAMDIATFGGASLAKSLITLPRLLSRTGQIYRNIAILSNNESATRVVLGHAEDLRLGRPLAEGAEDIVTEGSSPSSIAPLRQDTENFTGPELAIRRQMEVENTVLNVVRERGWARTLSPEQLAARTDEIRQTTREAVQATSRSLLDVRIRYGDTDNLYGVAVIGRSNGATYVTREGAQKLADKVGGEVVPQVQAGKVTYKVEVEVPISTAGWADPTDIKQINSSMLSNFLSSASRQPMQYDAMLKLGESQVYSVLRDITKMYRKVAKGVSRQDRGRVDEILEALRDDPLVNQRNRPYTEAEFVQEYGSLHNRPPPQKTVDFYKFIRDMNDTQYFIDADTILKQAVTNGERMLEVDGKFVRAVEVNPDPDALVWSTDKGSLVKTSSLPKDQKIFELKEPYTLQGSKDLIEYVTSKTPKTRRLYHSDVLNYNAGGHRVYSQTLKHFLKQDVEVTTLNGTVRPSDVTYMGVRTEAEAKVAADQWNTIAQAVRDGIDVEDLNVVIRANNDWNLSIEDIADLEEFARQRGLDISRDVGAAADGMPVRGRGWAGNETVGKQFIGGLNRSKGRGSQPLIGFGGEQLKTLSPVRTIRDSLPSAVGRRGDMRYIQNSVDGWLKAAQDSGLVLNADDLPGGPNALRRMDAIILDEKLEDGRALANQRRVIQQRSGMLNDTTSAQERILESWADSLYGQGWNKSGKTLDKLAQTDLAGTLRALAFHTKLGMFNLNQLLVQSSQVVAIVGMQLTRIGPVNTMRAMSSIPALRIGLIGDLSEANLLALGKLQAPVSGLTGDEFVQLVKWIKHTGRNVVNRSAVENNNSYAGIAGHRLLDWGQTFFNEGELVARLGAAATNFFEVRGRNIFEQKTMDAMVRRQDVLTGAMTAASSAPWQKSLAAVPLQFQTYTLRMAETLFTDKLISPKERVSLGLTLLAAYGGAGVPLAGWAIDRYSYNEDVDTSSNAFKLARWGALDAALSYLSGEETALSSRLGLGEGITDFLFGLGEDGVLETLTGPGGFIFTTMGKDFADAMLGFFDSKSFDSDSYDWQRLARNISGYDVAYKYFWGSRYGMSIARTTGEMTSVNVSQSEAFMQALGIPMEDRERLWSGVANTMRDDAQLDRAIKDLERMDNILQQRLALDDLEGASNIFADMAGMKALLTPRELEIANRRLSYTMTSSQSLIRSLHNRGKFNLADEIRRLTE